MSRHYSAQSDQLRAGISTLHQKMEQALDNSSDRTKWIRQFEEFRGMTELDRRAVVTLIQSIRVISKGELKINFRFQDEYNSVLRMLSLCKEAV